MLQFAVRRTKTKTTYRSQPPLAALVSPADFTDPAARAIAEVVFPWLEEGETFTMAALLSQLTPGPASSAAAQLFKES